MNPRSQAVRDYLGRLKQARDQALDEVRGVTPLYSYQYVLNGFSAKLTACQAAELARTPGVVSLARSKANHLAATTTTAGTATATTAGTATTADSLPPADTVGFLGLKKPGGLYSKIPGGQRNAGQGMIIGLLDSAIDTNTPSLQALPEPRPDAEAHGTHTATTAAGDADPERFALAGRTSSPARTAGRRPALARMTSRQPSARPAAESKSSSATPWRAVEVVDRLAGLADREDIESAECLDGALEPGPGVKGAEARDVVDALGRLIPLRAEGGERDEVVGEDFG
ncbi:protease inhibitor I9 family protein [Streptomyces scabiei]|uniref:protease inhibitor I9 family protein n=1 Tax=Streptomyces scabiei TaxID=1930 RepID=UPI000A56E368|nr:S8 family serine peptidase [Streptomyces scabiei]